MYNDVPRNDNLIAATPGETVALLHYKENTPVLEWYRPLHEMIALHFNEKLALLFAEPVLNKSENRVYWYTSLPSTASRTQPELMDSIPIVSNPPKSVTLPKKPDGGEGLDSGEEIKGKHDEGKGRRGRRPNCLRWLLLFGFCRPLCFFPNGTRLSRCCLSGGPAERRRTANQR